MVAGESGISTIDGEARVRPTAASTSTTWPALLVRGDGLPPAPRGHTHGAQLQAFRTELARERDLPDGVPAVLRAMPRSTHPWRPCVRRIRDGRFRLPGGEESDAARGGHRVRLTRMAPWWRPSTASATGARRSPRPRVGTPPTSSTCSRRARGRRGPAWVALNPARRPQFNARPSPSAWQLPPWPIHGAVTAAWPRSRARSTEAPTRRDADGRRWAGGARARLDRRGPGRKRKVMGFGHAVYRTEDPRATTFGSSRARWRGRGRAPLVRRDGGGGGEVRSQKASIPTWTSIRLAL